MAVALSFQSIRPRHAFTGLGLSALGMLAWTALVLGIRRFAGSVGTDAFAGTSSALVAGLLMLFDVYVIIVSVTRVVANRRRPNDAEGWIFAAASALPCAILVGFIALCGVLTSMGSF